MMVMMMMVMMMTVMMMTMMMIMMTVMIMTMMMIMVLGMIPDPLFEMPGRNESFLYFYWPEIPDICDESVTIISFAYCGFDTFPV